IAAKSDEHLGILRQLTRVLSDDEVTARLPGVQSAAELAALLNGEQLSQPLLLDDSTLLLDFPAQDLLALQVAAAGVLRNAGALAPAAVNSVLATAANPLGQGLWLARVAEDVLRTGVAFVRTTQPFSHEGVPVQGLLLIAARDAQHKPVLDRLIALISEQRVATLWSATGSEVIKLLTEAPQDGLAATFTIINPHGLHARPSAMLVKAVKEFSSQIWVANLDGDGKAVNAKSLMKLVSLGVRQGHRLHFTAKGDDAEIALQSIGQAIADGLGEGEGAGE
nr:fused PTS fructose transporter subunit IIA/HPr protein [Aeromonadaceae bacterium]